MVKSDLMGLFKPDIYLVLVHCSLLGVKANLEAKRETVAKFVEALALAR